MKRKPVLILILLTLLFSFIQTAQAQPPETKQEAVDLANQELGFVYFQPENEAGKPLNFIDEVVVLSDIYITDRTYGVLVYGDQHGDKKGDQSRYLGYTKDNEDYTNPGFPHDVWGGGYIEDRNWIREPWDDRIIQTKYGIEPNGFDGNPKTLERIQMGIAVYYAAVSKGGFSPYWQNWHEYVHILVPQTEYTWGMGRMWHKLSDGRMYYITIPIAPGALELNTRNLAVKDLKISPNPAEEGETVTVSANIANEGKEAENTLVQYRFHGNTVAEQNITQPAKGSVPVSFNITAPPAGKYSAGMVVNPNKDMPPDEVNILNGDWPGDNIAWDFLLVQGVDISVTAQPVRDKYIIPANTSSVKCLVNVKVVRKDNGEPIQVKLTAESSLGNQTQTFILGPGGKWGKPLFFTASHTGDYPVKIQAWPVGVQDLNPNDNVAYCTIRVEKQKLPEVSREPDLHSELGGDNTGMVWDPVNKRWVKKQS